MPRCATPGPQRLSSGSSGRCLQRQQQQRLGRRPACNSRSAQTAASDGRQAVVEQPQCMDAQPHAAAPPALNLLQQAARAAAGVAAAAVLALGALPPPAEAVLANPRAPVARSADVALRRSIPAFNADVAEVQERLEAVAFKLRIPQVWMWVAGLVGLAAGIAKCCFVGWVLSGAGCWVFQTMWVGWDRHHGLETCSQSRCRCACACNC